MAGAASFLDDIIKGATKGLEKRTFNHKGTINALKSNNEVKISLNSMKNKLKNITEESILERHKAKKINDGVKDAILDLRNAANNKNYKNLENNTYNVLRNKTDSTELAKALGFDVDSVNLSGLVNDKNTFGRKAGNFWGGGVRDSIKAYKGMSEAEKGVFSAIKQGHSVDGRLSLTKVAGTTSAAGIAVRGVNGLTTNSYGERDLPGVPFI